MKSNNENLIVDIHKSFNKINKGFGKLFKNLNITFKNMLKNNNCIIDKKLNYILASIISILFLKKFIAESIISFVSYAIFIILCLIVGISLKDINSYNNLSILLVLILITINFESKSIKNPALFNLLLGFVNKLN
jgi:hypothetical protein